ncbi:hypothetical protein UT300012_22810 [Paraclostridium bifermentans]
MHTPLSVALEGNQRDSLHLAIIGVIVVVIVTVWSYCYDRGKLVANRLGSFKLTGLGVTKIFLNFKNRYEFTREDRIFRVCKSALPKSIWYAIEPSLDTNSIYLEVIVRYYAYMFGYIYDKCILKIMVLIAIVTTAMIGTGIRWWNYIEILGFCIACSISNIYVAKILPLEYEEYKGRCFRDFEEFELRRKVKIGKLSEEDFEQYMKVEVWSRA